jgi:ATP-dependent HslUV protease ATP-binding subunit HslU
LIREPRGSLIKQYQALLATEGVELTFADDAVEAIARIAAAANEQAENIGARRLHTVLEKVLEELSFEADRKAGQRLVIDAAWVEARLGGALSADDLSRYIL